MKLEHIGIAVKDLKKADSLFSQLLGTSSYKQETVSSESVYVSFFSAGESKIELLAASEQTSTISTFIEKRGEGLHHIAFEVEDIAKEMQRLKELGFRLLNEHPKKGADNKWVCFVHPKDNHGVLVELCQEIKE